MANVIDVEIQNLKAHFLQAKPFVDVRAEIEFVEGSLPGAMNIPILQNDERARIGTCYKHSGREAAIQLGHKIVSGENREQKLEQWRQFFSANPEAILYCARGGLRSKISAAWSSEVLPKDIYRLSGGFKSARQYILQFFADYCRQNQFLIISGNTGSAKTHLLKDLSQYRAALDLEALAKHRGSAFGSMNEPQPRQVNFENSLFVESLKLAAKWPLQTQAVLLEDESRTIGYCVVPQVYFDRMRSSPVVMVDESLEQRVENIFIDYILDTDLSLGLGGDRASKAELGLKVFAKYKASVQGITKKLGGARAQELLSDLQLAEKAFVEQSELSLNRVWIEKLLNYYYDPMYVGSLKKRNPQIVFRGTRVEVFEYLKS